MGRRWDVGATTENEELRSAVERERAQVVQLEMDRSALQASLGKVEAREEVTTRELKEVLLCLQQYYVECEVLKRGVRQLGGEEVLEKLLSSSEEAAAQLFNKPRSEGCVCLF